MSKIKRKNGEHLKLPPFPTEDGTTDSLITRFQ